MHALLSGYDSEARIAAVRQKVDRTMRLPPLSRSMHRDLRHTVSNDQLVHPHPLSQMKEWRELRSHIHCRSMPTMPRDGRTLFF